MGHLWWDNFWDGGANPSNLIPGGRTLGVPQSLSSHLIHLHLGHFVAQTTSFKSALNPDRLSSTLNASTKKCYKIVLIDVYYRNHFGRIWKNPEGSTQAGIAQIAIASQRALWGTLYPGRFEQIPFELQLSMHNCPKTSPPPKGQSVSGNIASAPIFKYGHRL